MALKDPEVQVLQALHAPNVFLPTVVGDLENAILVTPVLQHFRSDVKLTGQHVRDLFGTLAHIHGTGRVHRDLRSDNIMCDHLHAYIIHLGYALNKTDDPVAFAGRSALPPIESWKNFSQAARTSSTITRMMSNRW